MLRRFTQFPLTYILFIPSFVITISTPLLAQTPLSAQELDLAANNSALLPVDFQGSVRQPYDVRAQQPDADAYDIQLERPYSVDDEFRFVTRGSLSNDYQLIRNAQVITGGAESSILELTADVTVLDVSPNQQILSASLDVVQSKLIQETVESLPFPVGTTILALVQDQETIFEVNGARIDGDLEEMLSMFVDIFDEGGPTDDQVFGTSESQQIGDSWAINPEAAAVLLEGGDTQNISGNMTLDNVVDNSLFISGSMTINNWLTPTLELDEFIVQQDNTLVAVSTRLPSNPLEVGYDSTINFLAEVVATHVNDPQMRLEMMYEVDMSSQVISVE